MTTRPSLVSSIPFWGLVAASVASIAVGAWLLLDKLGVMTTTLADGTATGVEVYVGQSVAVVGGILLGAGVVGALLALAVAAAASLRPRPEDQLLQEINDLEDEIAADADAAAGDAPVADAEQATAEPQPVR